MDIRRRMLLNANTEEYVIYYTSSGSTITPYNTGVFGVKIVSNTYINGQGIISFNGPVTSIGHMSFYGCKTLESITIPNSVTTIAYGAFMNCSRLTSITIPNSVTSIGDSAFYNCSRLTSITIPNSVTSIGDSAFTGCSKLASVYCKATTPPLGGSTMFKNNASNRKIYVPMESVDAYKSASYWSSYSSYIEGYNF